jgi:hypothetical protein
MRVGEAELDQAAALVDRRRRHGGGGGKVTELDHNLRVGDELLRDRHRLARIVLAVLEHVGERPAVDAARRIDLVEREIKSLLPLRAVLGRGPGERAAHPHHHRVLALGARGRAGEHGGDEHERRDECRLRGATMSEVHETGSGPFGA